MANVTFCPPPPQAGVSTPPPPPDARESGMWGVLAAPPLHTAVFEPERERSAFEIFGPPIDPPPFAGIQREELRSDQGAPSTQFVSFPKYDPIEHVGATAANVRAFVAAAGELSPDFVMQFAMIQCLQESQKLQAEEHGGRLRNGALMALLQAAKIGKEIKASMQKTVDVNLRGPEGSFEDSLRNLLTIPALQNKGK